MKNHKLNFEFFSKFLTKVNTIFVIRDYVYDVFEIEKDDFSLNLQYLLRLASNSCQADHQQLLFRLVKTFVLS